MSDRLAEIKAKPHGPDVDWLIGEVERLRLCALFQKLQTAVEQSEVGIELWFSSDEWKRTKEEGDSFMDFYTAVLERKS